MNCETQREQLIWKMEVALELIKKPPAVDDPSEEPYIVLSSLYQLRSGFDKTIRILEEVLTRVKPVAN
jgi:hypothetical protein